MSTWKRWIFILWLTGNLLNAQSVDYRFAWLSDLHIGSTTASSDLRQIVVDINNQPKIDWVIVSGDISEMDVGDNLTLARQILDSLQVPYAIIPGNHDTRWSDSGGRRFIKLWGSDKFHRTIGNLHFIGFDQGPLVRMGAGFISPSTLQWLHKVLKDSVNREDPLIFITHYPMDESVSNYDDFLKVLDGYNVQAILSGHVHANSATLQNNLLQITSRSILRSSDTDGGYNCITINDDTVRFFERNPLTGKEKLWYQFIIQKSPYHFLEQTGKDVTSGIGKVIPLWTFETGTLVTGSPVNDGHLVFIGDANGNLYALNIKTGKIKWCWVGSAPLLNSVAVHDKRVVFGSTDSNWYCLSTEKGESIWRFKTAAPIIAEPMIFDNIVLAGGSDGIFRAIELATGRLIWQNSDIQGHLESKPVVYNDMVIFGTWANKLYALDRQNGKTVWEWHDSRPGALYSPAACLPAILGNSIFIVAPDRYLSCIAAESGQTRWRSNRYRVRESLGQDSLLIFIKCMQDTVAALKPTDKGFTTVWQSPVGFGYDLAAACLVTRANRLYFGTQNGWIYCLDRNSGKLLWRYRLGKGLVNQILPISRREIIVSTQDGIIAHLRSR